MEAISVFDMLKIGIGPSSSHTLGPWRAAQEFVEELKEKKLFYTCSKVQVHLYGSLALTGHGHGTDIAVLLGLSGQDPVTIPVDDVQKIPKEIISTKTLNINQERKLPFDYEADIVFHFAECLEGHANGMVFQAFNQYNHIEFASTYFSVGGGFVVCEGKDDGQTVAKKPFPFPISKGSDLVSYCQISDHKDCISEVVWKNELAWRSPEEVSKGLLTIWDVMKSCIYRGCHTEGELPGGLNVVRRAAGINKKLLPDVEYHNADDWMRFIMHGRFGFSEIIKWIGCFAMAVNEENANFGRVVTAPTNGAAGVIPAVLMYYLCFCAKDVKEEEIVRFLLVSGEIGSLFKKGSTISAAMGGCQAEIGVSSAMAAAALTERLGGSAQQSLMAAEIAMEHHLGLTCDPVGGLVQVPCIERNSMGAMKAITAAKIALESEPSKAKVSLDDVIKTMWETAQDMNTKYKETSQGGLATQIAISVPEC
ncbi:MAG: L-serine ammonia-lyase [Bacteroidota bacterium]